jgi:hypothetical protein
MEHLNDDSRYPGRDSTHAPHKNESKRALQLQKPASLILTNVLSN